MMAWLRWCHRWLGLIILLQVFIWLVSGFYFSIVGNTAMAGNEQRQSVFSPVANDIHPDIVAAIVNHPQIPGEKINRLTWRNLGGFPQAIVELKSEQLIFDGRTGEPWRTTPAMAKAIAKQSYTGDASISMVDETSQQFRINFSDQDNTSVVIDKRSGSVVKHVTSTSAVADWMFKLHFMDYSGGKDFNNLLIRATALLALWFALAGVILLGRNFVRGDLWASRSLLSQLQHDGAPVKTVCGGGGTCGMCRVRFKQNAPPVSTAGKALLADEEIAQGIRLSCQQKALRKSRKGDVTILEKATLRQLFQRQVRERHQGDSYG